jgi:diguanylate cyclase (GGDEF)-like protein
MLQDRVGFMWFGTEDGLNRYDGRDMTQYYNDPADPASVGHDYIVAMAAAADGDIWIATNGGGLSRWNHSTDSFVVYRHDPDRPGSLASNLLRTVAVADDGTVWIGTRDAGLDRLDPASGTIEHFRHDSADPSSVADDHIYAVLADRQGVLWVGTDRGLDRLDPASKRFTHFRHDENDGNSLGDDRVRSLHRDHRGRLWVGTYGGGLNRMDGADGAFVRYRHDPTDPASLSHDRVRTVFEDRAGRIWVGTVAGLSLLDSDSSGFATYRRDPADPTSLSSDDVTVVYEDRGGVLWFGTQAGGVNTFNPATWLFGHTAENRSEENGLSHPNVTSISQDQAGRLWIGTFGAGLDVIDRAAGRAQNHRAGDPSGLSSNRVMALLHDSSGEAWIGTFGGGLNRCDTALSRCTVYRHDPGDPSSIGADGIMSLFEAGDGTLWVGTFGGGLNRFDRATDSFTRHLPDPAEPSTLSSPRVTSIVELADGRLWVGTDGGGLNLLDPVSGSARVFMDEPDGDVVLGAKTVLALHLDRTEVLWIGTQGGGLVRLEGTPGRDETPRFDRYSQRDGLSDDVVYGIEEDGSGALWLSTNRGLSRFTPHTGSFHNYDSGHGLQADEFNFGAHFRSSDGELIFGGVNGFNAFYPGSIKHNTHVPPVVLTSLLEFDRPAATASPVWSLQELALGYRDDVVSFDFAALDFASPGDNVYRYRLEGFDDQWIELGNRNRITFTDLDGGRYVLRIQAANNDGVWNEDGVTLPIRVSPPPWKTWWAFLCYGLLVAGALLVYRESHRRQLQREEDYSQRLEHEVQQRTTELVDQNRALETLNTKLVEASLTDSLTGLRNRRFLFEEVSKDIALVRRRYVEVAMGLPARDVFDVVFVMVDLDNFKEINDTFGHPEGDKVLVEMRDVLLNACRESDIVIRWGGDEFLVVGRDTDPDRAEALAHRIQTSVEEHVFSLDEGQVLRTTASIGFACFPFVRSHPDRVTWEQVLALADEALYAAKHLSRNAWVGFLSTEKSVEVPDLVRSIRDDPGRAAAHGHIQIRSSIPEAKWMVPEDIGVSASFPGEQ